MYILKKELEKFKDIYRYNYKILDTLIRYSLSVIQENIKDISDKFYVNNVILDVKKILTLTDALIINNEDCWSLLFKENDKHTLINSSEHSKKIKENYDALAKLLVK